MAQNIETKAKINSISAYEQKILDLGGKYIEILTQEDTYFNIGTDKRLKLRNINDEKFVLISYERPNTNAVKKSEWRSVKFDEKEKILDLLTFTFGIKIIVKKKRKVYTFQNTEIHLDKIENLGEYIELETKVINQDDSEDEHKDLIKDIGIDENDFINLSYSDLLLNKN